MQITIQDAKNGVSFDEINQLTESVGWGKRFHQTEEKWEHILAASTYIAYVKKEGKLVAFARILEDGNMCMFYDVCVHPNYQTNGIGRAVMDYLIEKIKDREYISIGLFVWEGNKTASEFYRKLGFEKSPAMELKKYMKKF